MREKLADRVQVLDHFIELGCIKLAAKYLAREFYFEEVSDLKKKPKYKDTIVLSFDPLKDLIA